MSTDSPRPYLRPTALQQLRSFLELHGAAVPPWSGFDEVRDALFSLLHTRRRDPEFFSGLSPFLESLRANAARGDAGLPAPEAELLGRETVESIVSQMQRTLAGAPDDATPSLLRSMLADSAAPLLCVALMTAALTGCASNDASPPVVTGSTDGQALPPPHASPSPSPADAGTTDAMVKLFRDSSPADAAAALERMLDAGAPPPRRPRRPPPPYGGAVPLYKGVRI